MKLLKILLICSTLLAIIALVIIITYTRSKSNYENTDCCVALNNVIQSTQLDSAHKTILNNIYNEKCVPTPEPTIGGVNTPPNQKNPREYIFLSYWCPGKDLTSLELGGYCDINQITTTGINWLLLGFVDLDWTTGTINVESILRGDCSKNTLDKTDFDTIVKDYLLPLHKNGVCISLSLGGESGDFPSTPPTDAVIKEMVSSFKTFRAAYSNVFDGVDLDFEHGGTSCINYINKIGQAFKDEGFLISCAPTAAQLHPGAVSGVDYQTFANIDLTIFDFVMPQWYQGGCQTTGTITGPYPNTFTENSELTKIGFCPKPGENWAQNAIDYINIWTQYPSVCSSDDFKSATCIWPAKPPSCTWNVGSVYGEVKDGLNRVVFDTPDKLNKLIIGVKTWSNATTQIEPGVATVSDIQTVVTAFPEIGGVGTWAIYHQCGNGDTALSDKFNTAVDVSGMGWYTDIGHFLAKKIIINY